MMKIEYKKWRMVKERSYDSTRTCLDAVFFPLIWIRLIDVSLDDFLKHIQTDKIINLPKDPINSHTLINIRVSHCPACKGWGKLDWIQQTTGVCDRLPWIREKKFFKTNDEVIRHYNIGDNEVQYYSSVPSLDGGEKICHLCFGCGIDMQQNHGKRTFYNSLGYIIHHTKRLQVRGEEIWLQCIGIVDSEK